MIKPRWRSKTNWVAAIIGAMGIVETNMPMLRDYLGDRYGLTYVAIAAIMFVLREITSEPVG